jgi:uncharacterized protein (TIGR02466 family)
MTILKYFATPIYDARLQRTPDAHFNRQLLRECEQLSADDDSGRRWSARNYPGGYTSYNSVARLHTISPTFAKLERQLNRHVKSFAQSLQFDLEGRSLAMTDCWVNIMPHGVTHSLHLHPLSTFSGTYFVRTPKGCPGLKFEDPRLDRFMAAPPRMADSRPENRAWITVPAESGKVVLFESWLRHEVSANLASTDRISISFNYNWF